MELTQEEYKKLLEALEVSKKRVDELQQELFLSRTTSAVEEEKKKEKKREKEEKKKEKEEKKKKKEEEERKKKEEAEKMLAATAPATSTPSAMASLAETHTSEHHKVLKLREQLRRAIERVQELAETASEDPDTVEDLPEELAWLLDTILQKDKEASSSAAFMAQLEMQMTAGGTSGGETLLSESERLEVDQLLQDVAQEESTALTQIQDVLATLLPELQGKPLGEEVDRLRVLALVGAERAKKTLSGTGARTRSASQAPSVADKELADKSSRTLTSDRTGIAPILPSGEKALAGDATGAGKKRQRPMSMPAGVRPSFEDLDLTPAEKEKLDKALEETPMEDAALPAVAQKFDTLEQRVEVEEPQLDQHVQAMRGTKSKVKEAVKSTKAALSKAFHITRKAERRKQQKMKEEAAARAIPCDGTEVGKLRAAMIKAIDDMLGPEAFEDKRRMKERAALIAAQKDEFLTLFAERIQLVLGAMERAAAENALLQAKLIDAQTKVWDRVKTMK